MAEYTITVHRISKETITVKVAAINEGTAKVRAEQDAMSRPEQEWVTTDRRCWAGEIV